MQTTAQPSKGASNKPCTRGSVAMAGGRTKAPTVLLLEAEHQQCLDTQKISKMVGYDLCITKVMSVVISCESDIAIKVVFGNM